MGFNSVFKGLISKSHSHWTTEESWFDFRKRQPVQTGSRAHPAYSTGSASADCSNEEASRVCRCKCLRNSQHSSRTTLKVDAACSSLMMAYISKLPRFLPQKPGIFMRTTVRMPTLARWKSLWECKAAQLKLC